MRFHVVVWSRYNLLSSITSSGSRGGGGGSGPPSPHFWGPRLYSEAQIAPFYTQITENFSKKFCLASLGILFQFSIDIFWSKTLENYYFWGPRLYSEAQIAPFYTQITENFSKNFASLHSAYYFNSQLTYFDQTLENYSFLRPQIIFWGPNYTLLYTNNTKLKKKFLPHFTQYTSLFKFSIDIFWSKYF